MFSGIRLKAKIVTSVLSFMRNIASSLISALYLYFVLVLVRVGSREEQSGAGLRIPYSGFLFGSRSSNRTYEYLNLYGLLIRRWIQYKYNTSVHVRVIKITPYSLRTCTCTFTFWTSHLHLIRRHFLLDLFQSDRCKSTRFAIFVLYAVLYAPVQRVLVLVPVLLQ